MNSNYFESPLVKFPDWKLFSKLSNHFQFFPNLSEICIRSYSKISDRRSILDIVNLIYNWFTNLNLNISLKILDRNGKLRLQVSKRYERNLKNKLSQSYLKFPVRNFFQRFDICISDSIRTNPSTFAILFNLVRNTKLNSTHISILFYPLIHSGRIQMDERIKNNSKWFGIIWLVRSEFQSQTFANVESADSD